jgi:predicted ArsR family transcriptional regulator
VLIIQIVEGIIKPKRVRGVVTDVDWESTWKEHASAFDRVRAVVMAADEARPASWIAEHARVAESTARDHLTRLAEMGMVTGTNRDDGTRYRPDPAYVRFREIRELTADYDPDELSDFVVELQESIQGLRDTHDVDSPNELRAAAAAETVSPAESRELRRAAADWEHYAYRLSLLEDAIARYDEYTGSPVPA